MRKIITTENGLHGVQVEGGIHVFTINPETYDLGAVFIPKKGVQTIGNEKAISEIERKYLGKRSPSELPL